MLEDTPFREILHVRRDSTLVEFVVKSCGTVIRMDNSDLAHSETVPASCWNSISIRFARASVPSLCTKLGT